MPKLEKIALGSMTMTQDGARWVVRWVDDNNRERSRYFKYEESADLYIRILAPQDQIDVADRAPLTPAQSLFNRVDGFVHAAELLNNEWQAYLQTIDADPDILTGDYPAGLESFDEFLERLQQWRLVAREECSAEYQSLKAKPAPVINQCDHGHETTEEVRLLPTSDGELHGNMIVCFRHFTHEIRHRRAHCPDAGARMFPTWQSLKIYVAE